MESIGQRIRQRRKQIGITQQQLADAFDIKRVSVTQWEGDITAPDRDKIAKLADLLGCDPEWLLRGSGDPPRALDLGPGSRGSRAVVSSFDPDADEHSNDNAGAYTREHWRAHIKGAVPEIDVKLGAGEGAVGDVINLPVSASSVSGHQVVAEWFIPDAYLRNEVRASPSHTLIMEVVGDSMFPTYSPGDRVLVDLSQDRLVTDTVYAISDGYSEPQIKRLQRVPFSEPTEVRIISDNPNLETFTVELSRVKIIGRICGHIARK
ncbi:S24 family peptidase [Sinorhizobium meliloti]|uniref:S24 family peptidase n=1 Tax=Rhizobium meliloti TaxID=382 RepID=UPI0001E4CD99|nr:S24 family peptidase [Sinorhizobium meliloti]AEG52541.1 helix-turn-helix domain protein [Sinorhizobium meliloti AK83]MDE4591738.1 helix-turn-helix domain-containing protein [Sinorhizobium meliloti]SEJ02214.1 Peptidase S24-like [Sinorhizobium meliloti]